MWLGASGEYLMMHVRLIVDPCVVENERINGRSKDCELIKLITLLIKYSGPPRMYAVGTVSFTMSIIRDRAEAEAKERTIKDESN